MLVLTSVEGESAEDSPNLEVDDENLGAESNVVEDTTENLSVKPVSSCSIEAGGSL